MTKVLIVAEGLRGIILPPTKRPPLGPDDDPTEELVCWGIAFHAYSQIAHIRTILEGLIVLANAGNTPAGHVLARHVFEWTALASFMVEKLEWLVTTQQWKLAFNLILQADTGNSWAKNYGRDYDAPPVTHEILEPLEINLLIAAYAKHQRKMVGKSTVHDSYSYLSERTHPNAACLVQYREIKGADAHLVPPDSESTYGGIDGFVLEWLFLIHELLRIAKEDIVRQNIVQLLAQALGVSDSTIRAERDSGMGDT